MYYNRSVADLIGDSKVSFFINMSNAVYVLTSLVTQLILLVAYFVLSMGLGACSQCKFPFYLSWWFVLIVYFLLWCVLQLIFNKKITYRYSIVTYLLALPMAFVLLMIIVRI